MVAKPSGNAGKKPTGLHPLLARFAERAEEIQAFHMGNSGVDLTAAYQCLLYRLEPQTYTGGAEYLRTFSEVPTEEIVQNLFGGGRYQLRIFQDGRIQPGAANFRIAGDPKLVSVDDTGDKAVVPGSTDGVLLGIVERKIAVMEEKIDDLLRRVGGASGGGNSLSPDRLSQMIDVANSKRLEGILLERSLGGTAPAASAPAASAPAASAPAPEMLEMVLKVFRAGVEFSGNSGGEGSDDLVTKGLSRLLDIITQNAGQTVPSPAVPPAQTDIPARDAPGTEQIEAQRRAVEKEVTERKAADMVERLQRAISVMLDAFEASSAYDVDDVCGFVRGVLSQEEIDRVGDRLTFDNVRQLMSGSPESQMSLDVHKDGVESVLTRLRAPEGGTSVS